MWNGNQDARWFKVKGTNLWVPSAYINGNPPNSTPMPSGSKLTLIRTGGGTPLDQIKQKIQDLQKEINEIQNKITAKETEAKKKEDDAKSKEWWTFLPWIKAEYDTLTKDATKIRGEISTLETDKKSKQKELDQARSDLQQIEKQTEQDVDALARTMWGEARSESYSGKTAVAWVIQNRASRSPSYNWPSKISDVCKQPLQFSCWNQNDPNYQKLLTINDQDAAFRECLEISRKVLNGELQDPSNGADHYYANYITAPNWAVGKIPVATIGTHRFYRLV
ncbi:cell wall hydrolase [Lyngbya sp. CCAP 1446/10]|nr:cell wall hydrolase [Lyngbya sp. CCAP 1446/10]